MQSSSNPNPSIKENEGKAVSLEGRSRIKTMRTWGSICHMFSIVILILGAVIVLPVVDGGMVGIVNLDSQVVSRRQMLLEGLDKIVRYQHYYRETQGGFTRDLARLGLPKVLSQGDFSQVHASYEVSVLEASDKRLVILATGKNDRVTMDERFRISANFILPPANKKYLLEEANRMLQLSAIGQEHAQGLYTSYWKLESRPLAEGRGLSIVGIHTPVVGDRHELDRPEGRALASIFNDVGDKLRNKFAAKSFQPKQNLQLDASHVRDWLRRIYLAQFNYKKETGFFATSIEELDLSGDLQKYANVVRILPIEINATGYRVSLEGLSGSILGEQFVLDQTGQVKQIRYTETIISKLQESSQILQGALPFQITEVGSEPPAILDSKNASPVKFNTRGQQTPQ
jgi:hypothetical protein